jgi:hypothetical protein
MQHSVQYTIYTFRCQKKNYDAKVAVGHIKNDMACEIDTATFVGILFWKLCISHYKEHITNS